MNTNNQPLNPNYMVWALFGGLGLWGLYLAVGATGFFSPANVIDYRKFLIVFACSAVFLGFWYANLWLSKRSASHSAAAGDRNIACWFSALCAIIGYGIWGIAYTAQGATVTFLGYSSAAMFTMSLIFALVGLSNPVRNNGKWLGLVSLLSFFLSIVLFFAQVHFYFSKL